MPMRRTLGDPWARFKPPRARSAAGAPPERRRALGSATMALDMSDDVRRGKNVFGREVALCGREPKTGFYRDGCCNTGPEDRGSHTVCTQVTAEFLAFSKASGNDLSTPVPAYGFPGLKPGDRWCVCAARWKQAYDAGVAPPVMLAATHEAALKIVPYEALAAHALDLN